MNSQNLCLACMNPRMTEGTCPTCGLDDRNLPEVANTMPIGTLLNGKYLIGRLLGAGGFGNTYLAFDLNLHTKLAIKEYLPKEVASRERNSVMIHVYTGESQSEFHVGMDKFLDEARVLARLKQHPNIVAVSDFFKENNTAYIVMDYLEGITFKEYLKMKGGRLSFEETMSVMTPVMDALREVHQIGLLHRDISPDNIYVTRSKQVKVLDFGAARQAMGEVSKSLSVILKPGYAPAEQYFSKGKQGAWTDIYAVGATIYHAVTGVLPPESLERMESDTLVPPNQQGANIPAAAEQALLRALAVRGADRFQTMAEFQQALLNISVAASAQQNSEPKRADAPPPPAQTQSVPVAGGGSSAAVAKKKGKGALIGLGIAGVLIVLMVIGMLTGSDESGTDTDSGSGSEEVVSGTTSANETDNPSSTADTSADSSAEMTDDSQDRTDGMDANQAQLDAEADAKRIAEEAEAQEAAAAASNSAQQAYVDRFNALDQKHAALANNLNDADYYQGVGFQKQRQEEWDALINDIWGYLKDTIPNSDFVALRDAQREWIKEKENVASNQVDYDGNLDELEKYRVLADYTRNRTIYLMENYF